MQIEERIRKLLALAAKNSNRSEAEAALLKAQQLMVEHHISHPGEDARTEVHSWLWAATRPAPWERQLAWVLAAHFRAEAIWHRGHGMRFFAHAGDLVLVRAIFEAAHAAVTRLASAYLATEQASWQREVYAQRPAGRRYHAVSAAERNRVRRSFIFGFIQGLHLQYQRQEQSALSYALIVVTPEAVKEHIQSALGKTEQAPIRLRSALYSETQQVGVARGQAWTPQMTPLALEGGW